MPDALAVSPAGSGKTLAFGNPICGGTSVTGQAERAGGSNVVVTTPCRLHDLLERKLVSPGSVRVLVLDEADRMLDMDFDPQVDRILKEIPHNPQ